MFFDVLPELVHVVKVFINQLGQFAFRNFASPLTAQERFVKLLVHCPDFLKANKSRLIERHSKRK